MDIFNRDPDVRDILIYLLYDEDTDHMLDGLIDEDIDENPTIFEPLYRLSILLYKLFKQYIDYTYYSWVDKSDKYYYLIADDSNLYLLIEEIGGYELLYSYFIGDTNDLIEYDIVNLLYPYTNYSPNYNFYIWYIRFGQILYSSGYFRKRSEYSFISYNIKYKYQYDNEYLYFYISESNEPYSRIDIDKNLLLSQQLMIPLGYIYEK